MTPAEPRPTDAAPRYDAVAAKVKAYMAGSMAMPDYATDQEQNWLFGHLVTLALQLTDRVPVPAPPATETQLQLHRCKTCGTAWLLWPSSIHGGGWNLLDKYQRPGACCDNAPMGEQIEHLRDIPLQFSARTSVILSADRTLPVPDGDVPREVAAELMNCCIQHGNISYQYLLDIYRKGRAEPSPAPPAVPPQLLEFFRDALMEFGAHHIECGIDKSVTPWKFAEGCTCGFDGAYHAAEFLSLDAPTEADIQRTQELAKQFGWETP